MALPENRAARDFYRVALQRYDEAKSLLVAGHTTAAIYLAGYTVECALKSKILEHTPKGKQKEIVDSFRGSKAHNYEWLKLKYKRIGGAFSDEALRAFVRVNTWSTEDRYRPGEVPPKEARDFIDATRIILTWAFGTFEE